jgi:hypothetical protein
MQMPIKATVDLRGRIILASVPTPVLSQGFIAGQRADLQFTLNSTVRHDVPGAFSCVATPQSPFSSATLNFTVPGRSGANPISMPVTLSVLCKVGTPAGQSDPVTFNFVSVAGDANATITLTLKTQDPPPPKPVDRSVVWEETTDLSISIDPSKNAWHAGRLTDILLRSDDIFVAASTGGVWGINFHDPDAPAGCVTDSFDNPNFNCMAFGPDSPLEIYAACSSLQLGARPGTGLVLGGFAQWSSVPIVDATGNALLTDDIYRIVVLPQHRVMLLATMQGVFLGQMAAGLKPTFASVPSLLPGRYSGMCQGPNESVVVSLWGPNGGIFVGTWSGSTLNFAAAQMVPDPAQPNGSIDLTLVGRSSIASCGSNPSIMYAVFERKPIPKDIQNDSIYRILRSADGGLSWRPLRNLGTRVSQNRSAPIAPDIFDPSPDVKDYMAGVTGSYTNCIGVGFHDSNQVGIGWANGPWLTSNASDVLSKWILAYDTANSSQVHGDIQFVLFDPGDPSGNTIYACSDGGLMFTQDRAGDVGYQSRFSKHIRNLQFYANVGGGNGTFAYAGCGLTASPTVPGLIAGPTQDNGNIFCNLENTNNPAWQVIEGGDGLPMRFLSNGLLLTVSPNDNTPPPRRARLSHWNGTAFDNLTEVPVTSPNATALSVFGDLQPVTNPSFKLPGTGKLLFAIAATQNAGGQQRNIYGLFTDGSIAQAEWQLIATLNLNPGDAISSIASLTGHQVFAGTLQGRIFSVAPFQDPFELVVSPADKGPVHDITVVREDDALAFALYNGPNTRAILQSEFFNWDPLGSNSNVARGLNLDGTENFIALTIDRATSPPSLYVCTDTTVFVSRDEGDTWLLANTQLPSRVHCTSFAIGAPRPSGRHLYLGTYGRSVWQAKI